MKVSDQVKAVQLGFDAGTHSFFTKLATALQQRIATDTGVQVDLVGKSIVGKGGMSAALVGEFTDNDSEKVAEVGQRTRDLMAELKNPSSLVDLLK